MQFYIVSLSVIKMSQAFASCLYKKYSLGHLFSVLLYGQQFATMGLFTVRSIYMVQTRMSFLLFGLAIWSGVSSANVCTAGINETAPIVEHVEYQIGDIANLRCEVPENLQKGQIKCKSDHNPNIDHFGDKYDRQFRSKKGIYVLTVNNLTTDDFTTYECGYSVNNSYEQVCCFNLQLVELMNGSDVSETIESSFTSTDETETFLDEDYITKESNSDKQIFWCALKKRSTFQVSFLLDEKVFHHAYIL